MLRAFLILTSIFSVAFMLSDEGIPIGPCLGYPNISAITTVHCENVSDSDDLLSVFTTINETFLEGVNIVKSPLLTTLPDALFGPVAVQTLVIEETGLRHLSNSFFNFPTSETLITLAILLNSQYSALEANLISGLTKLNDFYVSYNRLGSLVGKLPPTTAIYLEFTNNNILQISSGFFSGASLGKNFVLSNNNLTTASMTPGTLDFTNTGPFLLELNDNRLSSGVPLSAFTGSLPKQLQMANNGITTLDENTFAPLIDAMYNKYGNNASIILAYNHIVCDCSIQWLMAAPGRDIVILTWCSDGRPLEDLTSDDFVDC